jgi:hypothetical protein
MIIFWLVLAFTIGVVIWAVGDVIQTKKDMGG